MRSENPSPKRTILAVHPGALGDLVLFGRLLRRLDGAVTLLAGGEKARLLFALGDVAAARDFESLPMHELFADAPSPAGLLPGLLGHHDVVLSCFGNEATNRRLAAKCGSTEAHLLPVRPPETFEGHLLELWADRLALPRRDLMRPDARPVPPTMRRAAAEALAAAGAAGQRYAAIHPGSGSQTKCWPLERFTAAAEELAGACGLAPVVILGPVELERWSGEMLAGLRQRHAVLSRPTLETLAGVLGGASVYVGNDSGPSHLAAAVGAPTVVLFGATRARHFAPVGPKVCVLSAESVAAIRTADVVSAAAALAGGGGERTGSSSPRSA